MCDGIAERSKRSKRSNLSLTNQQVTTNENTLDWSSFTHDLNYQLSFSLSTFITIRCVICQIHTHIKINSWLSQDLVAPKLSYVVPNKMLNTILCMPVYYFYYTQAHANSLSVNTVFGTLFQLINHYLIRLFCKYDVLFFKSHCSLKNSHFSDPKSDSRSWNIILLFCSMMTPRRLLAQYNIIECAAVAAAADR